MDQHSVAAHTALQYEPVTQERTDYAGYPLSQPVPERYNNMIYGQGKGFATHHQADVGGSQRTQHPLSGQIEVGRRSQPLPHALSIQFQQYDLMSGAIMSVYAQGQPPVYDDSQVNPNINVHHQILPLSVHGFAAGLEGLYNRDSDVPVPGSRTRQISDSMSEGAHLVYPQSSPPVPGRSVHLAAGPIEYSPPGTRLSDQPSHIHEGYTNSSPANTSGDLRTTGSLLFAEDSPQPKRKPPSRINHYTTVEQIPHPELSTSPRRSTRSRSTVNKAATLLQDNKSPVPPLPEGGIEGFCERSFPHERNLRDNLQVIMVSKKVENDDLEQFLETNDAGGNQRFKCLFGIESGQCGKTFKRKDKAGGHIRQVHIKMFPVPCQGHCGDPRCSLWFSSPAAKSSHARKGSTMCENCNALTSARNIKRHQRTKKCQRVIAEIAAASGS